MGGHKWIQEFSGAVTVCDPEGTVLEMNDEADRAFRKWGGKQLLGSNLLECHPEPACSKLRQLMEERRKNVYTIEKKGIRKLVYQAPWYVNGQYQGFVEIVIELPSSMPHFIRDASP
ncbi:MAG: PAS domain-containing protein [Thermodesulfovibrionales bacterium]|nr:PAS domain-containing protein [Thermodesulfovibrionales bacterium]